MAPSGFLSIRIPYRVIPLTKAVAKASGRSEDWFPTLTVAIIVGHATSKRFEAVVDSGSGVSLFHASIGQHLGLKLKDGEPDALGGVVGGAKGEVYFHQIKLKVLSDIIPITAGFSEQLSVAGILGRQGFFENFVVTFDPCNNPPGLVLDRISRT